MFRRQANDELIELLTDQLAQIIRRGAVWKRVDGRWASEFMSIEKLKHDFAARLSSDVSLRVFGKVLEQGKSREYARLKESLNKLSREELEQLFNVVTLEVPHADS